MVKSESGGPTAEGHGVGRNITKSLLNIIMRIPKTKKGVLTEPQIKTLLERIRQRWSLAKGPVNLDEKLLNMALY